jgi:dephospho-CoA kinase
MILIGITGIVGSGKTTVSAMLGKECLEVIDLDKIAKEIVRQERIALDIGKALGSSCVTEGMVDIKKVAELVFHNKEAREKLESIVHPLIDAEMHRQVNRLTVQGTKTVIIDGPLIFEKGLHKELNKIIVVSGKAETIRARLKKRGMDEGDAERRMASQIPLKEKEALADYIIRNDGTMGNLEKEVGNLLKQIKEWEVELNAP